MAGDDRKDVLDGRDDVRRLDPLDRLEAYSAAHAERYQETGDLPASIFEDLWTAFEVRTALDRLEEDHRSMMSSLYANPGADKDALENAMKEMDETVKDHRRKILNPKLALEAEKAQVTEDGFVTYEWWKKPGGGDGEGDGSSQPAAAGSPQG